MAKIDLDLNAIEALNRDILNGMAYEKSRSGPPEDFPELPDIPGGRYVDETFWEAEWDALWKKSWFYACHSDQLPEAGSYMLWQNTGSPILIVRGEDQQIRAFYNTCRHRGAPLVMDDAGNARGLVCSYHGWTYNLEGELLNMRDKRDFVNLDMSCKSLVPVRCEMFGNWVFVSEDPDAEPLLDYLGPVATQLMQFQPDRLRYVDHHGFDVKCNIKVLMDAFLETYHVKSIHQHTVDRFIDSRGTTVQLWDKGHSIMCTPNRREGWRDPGTIGLQHMDTVTDVPRVHNLSFNIFPNFVTPPHAAGIPVLTFWPKGQNEMRVESHWFAPDWGEGEIPHKDVWDKRIANWDRILFEDTQFAEHIQKSVQSPGFKGVSLSYQERRLYHWHEELDRRIRQHIDNPPEHLMLDPAMERWRKSKA
ncbi:MAG: aromatic ring-hydroxylating oxygenase subunit alpha [Alphaproteobacteria bacterium]